MKSSQPKTDCRFFNGYKPCAPHKASGVHCPDCQQYDPITQRILVIKTGAAGEVLRNTPLLHRLRKINPGAHIVWLTKFPEMVPRSHVDQVLVYNWESCLSLMGQKFDLLLSLDKDVSECALATKIEAREKRGFIMDERGRIAPAHELTRHKWLTGFYDDLMRVNNKHYVEEIFEICGWEFQGEEYILDPPKPWPTPLPQGEFRVGLNTGAGPLWKTRVWSEGHFIRLTQKLMRVGFGVVLLGGPDEEPKNKRIALSTGAYFPGVVPLKDFFSLMNTCDVVVTGVTMALHVSIALKKQTLLLNNIFPANEFHLYGRGRILQPGLTCQSCYKALFDEKCQAVNCLDLVSVEYVYENIIGWGPIPSVSKQDVGLSVASSDLLNH